ncbi:hypothetical protein C3R74_11445 [Acidithiobacillus ferridurans]|uniref:hypothetical protein n=1 Tax=Acidithiobacillus ferridurans TaxID=1232575 RepID=UPI000DE2BFA2|nr:hypothetical protein [Acidithiobacillus ferridurans]RBL99126.1 hypothetical protein C3R74_11445 [Acidithiobacillus ferridurans]
MKAHVHTALDMACVTVEILTQHDHADYGEDFPYEYTARVAQGSIEDAISLLKNLRNLRGSAEFVVFNIETNGDDVLKFLSFENAEVGKVFSSPASESFYSGYPALVSGQAG